MFTLPSFVVSPSNIGVTCSVAIWCDLVQKYIKITFVEMVVTENTANEHYGKKR